MTLAPLLLSLALVNGFPRDVEYQVFQFPANQIPRIDGDPSDWDLVPESYVIGTDQLRETVRGLDDRHDRDEGHERPREAHVRSAAPRAALGVSPGRLRALFLELGTIEVGLARRAPAVRLGERDGLSRLGEVPGGRSVGGV